MAVDGDEAGVANQVGLVLRYSPAFNLVKPDRRPESGRVMSVVFRDDQFIPIQGHVRLDLAGRRGQGRSGTLLEHSIHDLDIIEYLPGRWRP